MRDEERGMRDEAQNWIKIAEIRSKMDQKYFKIDQN